MILNDACNGYRCLKEVLGIWLPSLARWKKLRRSINSFYLVHLPLPFSRFFGLFLFKFNSASSKKLPIPKHFKERILNAPNLDPLIDTLARALVENLPLQASAGGFIAKGYLSSPLLLLPFVPTFICK